MWSFAEVTEHCYHSSLAQLSLIQHQIKSDLDIDKRSDWDTNMEPHRAKVFLLNYAKGVEQRLGVGWTLTYVLMHVHTSNQSLFRNIRIFYLYQAVLCLPHEL